MEVYVGLDVSLKETAICVVDGSGKIVTEGTVLSEPSALAGFLRAKAGARSASASRPARPRPGFGTNSERSVCR
jgi:hypothetical protein